MFFFFQAKDDIRDIGVTGVQTCALPIFARPAGRDALLSDEFPGPRPVDHPHPAVVALAPDLDVAGQEDRKSVVLGKSVDLGGCRIIKKNNTTYVITR